MTHHLINAYGLPDDMDLLRVAPATEEDLKVAHSEEYLDLLCHLMPAIYENAAATQKAAQQHGLGEVRDRRTGCSTNDNPVIDDIWDYCLCYAGGSLAAARALASGRYRVAINWSGGMHHACEGKASGFCYVTDAVVAIKVLLGRFGRVLYVDIDAHHGDGVESAFLEQSRVMTVSFHQYDGRGFFPGTGGALYRALNVPLEAGTGDDEYHRLFGPIMERVMQVFRPDAVVLQCGTDSLAGDRITGLQLSVRGHAKCVHLIRSYDVPLLLLGGGGYTINHVASCWCYETAVAIGKEIPDDIPQYGFQRYYKSQGYKLHYYHDAHSSNSNDDARTKRVTKVKQRVMAHLDHLAALMAAPSTQPDEEPACPAVSIDGDALVDRSPRGEKTPRRGCTGVAATWTSPSS
ncbi:hypothetical protein SETIT_5G190100v2 [Setaria italica]|uniref:Histone deacetylase n=1 Tax=Setaria italica TaxID=4555 RepID=A0A368R6B3_SETIT|nr:hypothetical protein SETIT_5G190100v2 [Setaria italica]